MSVVEKDARSFTKNAETAPKLAIGLPCRKTSPVEFWMCLFQLLPPLNTKISYMYQKAAQQGVKDGQLGAEARNSIIERALSKGARYVFFLDDDVLFPDITLYRMWVNMNKHPEIGCITAVGTTKLNPVEPLIYQHGVQGAWWDWQIGGLAVIESAWAGCMLVDLEYVKKMKAPWFNDVVFASEGEEGERVKQNIWGHDRWFHKQLTEQTGGAVVADTGLLVAHFDAELQQTHFVPPDSPPYQKPILGESFLPFFDDDGMVNWRRIIIPDRPDRKFKTYLNWLMDQEGTEKPTISILPTQPTKIDQHDGFTVRDSRKADFSEWMKDIGAEE